MGYSRLYNKGAAPKRGLMLPILQEVQQNKGEATSCAKKWSNQFANQCNLCCAKNALTSLKTSVTYSFMIL
jgi:hypothetical protein